MSINLHPSAEWLACLCLNGDLQLLPIVTLVLVCTSLCLCGWVGVCMRACVCGDMCIPHVTDYYCPVG